MSPLLTLRVAVRAILRNKLRAFLTTLGIVIGVGAVIAMMAIGAGAKQRVEEAFAAMGTNVLIILPGSTNASGVHGGFGSMPTLTWDDFAAIRTDVATVKAAAPTLRSSLPVVSEDQNWTTSITGTSPDYFDIRNWPIALGASITSQDVEGGTKVIVLGQTVVDKLYGPNADPVGQNVRVGSTPFTIVGVAARKGQSATGQDYDDAAFIPYTTFARKVQGGLGKFLQGSMMVAATSSNTTARAQQDITALLRDRHHIAASADDDFSIRNLSEIQGAQQQGTDTMTKLLASVAAVSLLVGGIGIMNIMLVSVTERTREIGIRMAVGAEPNHILMQFLVEAVSLSVAGGLIGVAIGVGVAAWIAKNLHWPVLVQPDVIMVSVGFSALVGIVFGIYPARKAAQLDPIDALRFE
ncbi:MAG TPA: ABC transporter permease [Polyangiaceae bacterium]|jgi:putative ABC transport system permease protein|nr:ABC transporter permease [Polyangiaceae bacterium]